MALDLVLPVPGSNTRWCAIFHTSQGSDTHSYSHRHSDLIQIVRTFHQRHPNSGLQITKIEAIHGDQLCALACKPDGKEVLLLIELGVSMRYKELLTLDTVGSCRKVTMSDDSTGLKIFLIEGGQSGDHEVVLLYESRTQAWRAICKLPVVKAKSLHQFPTVGLGGQFLYVLVGDAVLKSLKIAELDFGRNEWVEYDVVTPRAFSRVRLIRVEERLMLVGFLDGCSNVDRIFVMNINCVSSSRVECVEISEMPRGFCAALGNGNTDSVLKFQRAVCGYKDSIFFMSSGGKPVVYSTTKNAWSYVPVFNTMQNPKQGLAGRPLRWRESSIDHGAGIQLSALKIR